MVRQLERRYARTPDAVLVDGGFVNLAEIEALAESAGGTTLYAPPMVSRDQTRDPFAPLPTDAPAVAAWRVRMATPEAKRIYRERAATAECVYALLAALAGLALAPLLEPLAGPLRVASVAVLAAIGARGLLFVARRDAREMDPAATPASSLRTYGQLVGLTILNPLTVTYFAALMLGLGATGSGPAEKAAFVAAAFAASLSWQTLLAVAGALLHRHASGRLRVVTSLAGNLIVLGFAARIAAELVAG